MLFEGELTICQLENIAAKGLKPADKLVPSRKRYYGSRTVGYYRQYAALGADQRIDKLVRIWRDSEVKAGDYALIGEEQYRIDFVQHLLDEDDLQVTDLTLRKLEANYDVITADP